MTVTIGRRELLAALGGAAAAWPLAARAQQSKKLLTIGFLGADATVWSSWTAAFVARLRELGWIEGRTVAIQYRWSEGRQERVAEIAAEFVRLKVDVIVTNGDSVDTARRATALSHRLCISKRPGRRRTGGKFGPTGRQRDRPVAPSDRSWRQAARTLA